MISMHLITGVKPRTLILMKKQNKSKQKTKQNKTKNTHTKKPKQTKTKTKQSKEPKQNKKRWCFRSKIVSDMLLLLIDYGLGNHNLLSVASASQNDLGIIATNNLNWKMHINQMICKAIFCA